MCEDATENGAWAWARLREWFGRDSGATIFTEVFQHRWPNEKPFEDVWREWVNKVSKLPQGSLNSQAIEQLTISGWSRHGQPELENHLRLRAPMARLRSKTCLSTIYHQQSPQPMDISAVWTGDKCQNCGSQAHQRNDCWYKDETCKTCGKRGHWAKVCRSGNAQTPRHGNLQGKVQAKAKAKARNEHLKHVCVVARKDTRKQTANSRLRHVQNCGKSWSPESVSKHEHTHEIEKDADAPSPEVTVEAGWCVDVRDIVEDDHCDCTENHNVSSVPEHPGESKFRKVIKNIETNQNSRKVIKSIETGEQNRQRRQKSRHE